MPAGPIFVYACIRGHSAASTRTSRDDAVFGRLRQSDVKVWVEDLAHLDAVVARAHQRMRFTPSLRAAQGSRLESLNMVAKEFRSCGLTTNRTNKANIA